MGVDIGIYCTIDKEIALSRPEDADWDLDYWEKLGGDPLVEASYCTKEGDYRACRFHKVPNWIGDLLWIVRGVQDGDYPYIKKVYIRSDCDGPMVEANEESITKLVKLWIQEGHFLSVDQIGEKVYAD